MACGDPASSTGAGILDPRSSNDGVWTGAEMIVWGGDVGLANVLNTGGRYDPATDTWTAISTETPRSSALRL